MLCRDILFGSNDKSSNCVSESRLKPRLLIFLQNVSTRVNSSSCVEKLFRKLNLPTTNYTGFPIDGLGQMKLWKSGISTEKR